MAVLEAVRGWEYLAGLPHIGEAEKEAESENISEEELGSDEDDKEVPLEEGMWTAEELENQLDSLVNSDYVSLLLEHEEHIRSPASDSICKLYYYNMDCRTY